MQPRKAVPVDRAGWCAKKGTGLLECARVQSPLWHSFCTKNPKKCARLQPRSTFPLLDQEAPYRRGHRLRRGLEARLLQKGRIAACYGIAHTVTVRSSHKTWPGKKA